MEKKTYRVFVTRHYIAVGWVDIKAVSPKGVKRKAEELFRKLKPDARAETADSGWVSGAPVVVEGPGAFQGGTREMKEIDSDAFIPVD